MDDDTWGITPAALDTATARQQLQRAARDLQLVERGGVFTMQGRAVLDLASGAASADAGAVGPLTVRLARRPAQTPEWDTRSLRTAGDLRQCIDELRRRVARWRDDD